MNTNESFAGQVIAVTGGAQGIGLAIAQRLASHGATLAIADINLEKAEQASAQLRAAGGEAMALQVDVTQRSACERMVADIVARFGRLDVMICNAGVVQVKPFLEIDEKDWDTVLGVNAKGVFLTVQAAARQMRSQTPIAPNRPKGKIINLSSIAGRYGAGPMAPLTPHYRASKAAVISITQTCAYALAPDVTVNAICPGLVETDMWKQIDQQWTEIANWKSGDAWKSRVSAVPLGRPQTSEDVAGLAAYLVSKDSDYMTGQSVNMDGGLSMS
ncbi:SDR family NAD(P)-dependent oxidoreductase [Pararobbsia silviterrae]|uniref:SDR family NAD(P)-dependent oxidoreductase n=1 Tax=Pararobbsia silviterrae TaxID=1792498 RepID=UPI001314ED58|nr:glucose 1-dehydrogenase [Pararobbsia silviterrae]